jgi:hypothetical protein
MNTIELPEMPPKAIRTSWHNRAVGILLAAAALLIVWLACGRQLYYLFDEQGGPYYLTLQAADLDNDADLDVLVHNMRNPMEFLVWSGGTLWINGGSQAELSGGRQASQLGKFTYRRSELEGGISSVLAEVDGDGDLDLLVDGGSLVMGYNQGGVQEGRIGQFKLWATIPQPKLEVGQYGVLLAGDIDSDGRNDTLVLGRGQAYATTSDNSYRPNISWIWLNKVNEHGVYDKDTFVIIEPLHGLSVAAAVLADLDGDGDLDLTASASPTEEKSMLGSAAYLLLNDGSGVFSDSGLRIPAKNSSSLALGDLDGDSDPDALLGYDRGALILLNQGGVFTAADRGLDGRRTRGVELADLDGDGDLDALVAGKRQAALWWNDGQGQFTQAAQSFPCTEDQNLTTGDFNKDGWVDIFIAQYDDNARVWWNTGEGSFMTGWDLQSAQAETNP